MGKTILIGGNGQLTPFNFRYTNHDIRWKYYFIYCWKAVLPNEI